MEIFSLFNKTTETKDVPKGIAKEDFTTRGAVDKLYIPLFLYKPPFGWPRNQNIPAIRRLAQTPQAAMGIKAIIDVIDTVPWDIVPKEGFEEDNETVIDHIKEVKTFFQNPNETKETFGDFQRKILRDMIEINSGVINKEFNAFEQFVGMVAADGSTMLMNPNRFNKFTERDELILTKNVFVKEQEGSTTINGHELSGINFVPDTPENTVPGLTIFQASNKAAYFQFPWTAGTGGKPVPFGIREIVWIQDNPTTSSIYGISIFENLLEILQTLVYLVEFYQDYFEDNNVPKGLINLEGATDDGVDDFADRWNESQLTVNRTGQIKKAIHRVPIANFDSVKFERIQFTAEEIDFIATTKLFSQIVWGMIGLNPSEVGFTENTNRATELAQDKKFMRRGIRPRLKKLEEKYNHEILSEFNFDDVEFKFIIQNLDDDTTQAKLWKIQLDGGWKTVNEIRKEAGMPPMDGGDELGIQREERMETEKSEKEEQSRTDSQEAMMQDRDKLNSRKAKAFTSDTAATLGPFEAFGRFKKILDDAKKKLIDLTRQNVDKKRLKLFEGKGLDEVVLSIDNLFSAISIKSLVDQVIKDFYRDGNEKAERQLDMNLPENPAQIKALADMTFDNIQGVTEDLKNKLRGILQRALTSGKSLSTISAEIKTAFDVSHGRADAIARTETARAEQNGQLNAMKSSGLDIRKYIIIVKDNRTSEVSFAMDSKYGSIEKSILLDKLFHVVVNGKTFEGQAPPFMPNDRDEVLYITQQDFEESENE